MAYRKINYSPEALSHRREYQRKNALKRYYAYKNSEKFNSPKEKIRRRKNNTECVRRYRASHPNSSHMRTLYMHHFSQQRWDELLVKQGGVCPVCKKPLIFQDSYNGKTPSIDHDHSCCSGQYSCGKCIRGILHARCNNALGCVDDNSVALRNAADYLDACQAMKHF